MKQFLILLMMAGTLFGASYTVSENTIEACSTAVAQCAASGDTVLYPSGTIAFNRPLVVAKAIVHIGKGDNRLKTDDSTKILISYTTAYSGCFTINSLNTNLSIIKLIIFEKDTTVDTRCNSVHLTGPAYKFIVDSCKFQHFGTAKIGNAIKGSGIIYALIRKSYFYRVNADAINFAVGDTNLWYRSNLYGTRDQIVIEDCVFDETTADGGDHSVTASVGSSFTVRYCTSRRGDIDMHGYCTSGPAGIYKYEVYHDSVNMGANAMVVFIRGGNGIVWTNGFYGFDPGLYEYRADNGSVSCGSLGCCTEGYPCKYQIGRGRIQPDGTQLLKPVLSWDNTNSRSGQDGELGVRDDDTTLACHTKLSDYVKVDRDYYVLESAPSWYKPLRYPHPWVDSINSLCRIDSLSVDTIYNSGNNSIKIYGRHFGHSQGDTSEVFIFDKKYKSITLWTDSEIVFTDSVPDYNHVSAEVSVRSSWGDLETKYNLITYIDAPAQGPKRKMRIKW
jgi:hypothetical protein